MIPSQALHQETVDAQVDVRVAQGTGPPNRHGMPRLPIGQHEVSNWPVLDLGDQPVIPQERWSLQVTGLVVTSCGRVRCVGRFACLKPDRAVAVVAKRLVRRRAAATQGERT